MKVNSYTLDNMGLASGDFSGDFDRVQQLSKEERYEESKRILEIALREVPARFRDSGLHIDAVEEIEAILQDVSRGVKSPEEKQRAAHAALEENLAAFERSE